MPVSEKQKQYARKWDKDNMRTLGTRVRTVDAENYKRSYLLDVFANRSFRNR